jgi:hypothetical protein
MSWQPGVGAAASAAVVEGTEPEPHPESAAAAATAATVEMNPCRPDALLITVLSPETASSALHTHSRTPAARRKFLMAWSARTELNLETMAQSAN